MKEILSKITIQDALQIIIIVLPYLGRLIKNKYYEKHLKCKKLKSSLDRYLNYYIFWYFAGLIVIVVYVFLLAFLCAVKETVYSLDSVNRIFLTLFTIGVYVCFLIKINLEEDTIKLKKKYKYSKVIKILLTNVPIILSGLVYSLFYYNFFIVLIRILGVVLIILEVLSFVILDSNCIFEYKYVSFYLKDNKEIKEIKTEQVKFKGDWIIIKNKTIKNEVRFREQDVWKIEYNNGLTQII